MKQVNNNNIYIIKKDEVVKCPECDSSTEFEQLKSGAQLHDCTNHDACGLSFIVEVDKTEHATTNKIKVVFKKFKNPDGFNATIDVIALFPDEKTHSSFIQSYQHIGQHSDASPELIDELKHASMCEYKNLYNELVSVGYDNLEIINYEPYIDYIPPAIEEPRESGSDNETGLTFIRKAVTEHTGDNVMLDVLTFDDGRYLAITDEVVILYEKPERCEDYLDDDSNIGEIIRC